MTSVIIVEDSMLLANLVAAHLRARHGYSVTCVKDPHALQAEIRKQRFDFAVVDLLFEHLNREFDAKRKAGTARLASPTLLVTGLTAIKTLQDEAPDTRIVVWTSGEANRRLHILYAYEELGQRVFCAKDSDGEHANGVAEAIRASAMGVEYIDSGLNSYLPAGWAATLTATVLQDEFQRAVWRAIAIGAPSRAAISRMTGYATHYIGNRTAAMYANLRLLDPGLPESREPLTEMIRYASFNWHFFLDDAVRRAYP